DMLALSCVIVCFFFASRSRLTRFSLDWSSDVCSSDLLLYTATSADDLAAAITAARDAGIPYFVLGLGANILMGDGGFRGLVIRKDRKRGVTGRWGRTSGDSHRRAVSL